MMDLLSVIVCALLHLNRVLMKLRTPTQMLSYLLMYEMNPSLHDYLVLNDYFAFVLNQYESYASFFLFLWRLPGFLFRSCANSYPSFEVLKSSSVHFDCH